MPPVDKIDEVPDDVWEVLFHDLLSPEVLRRIDVPVMNEAAVEDFESWSKDEPTVSSTTATASEELHVPTTDIRSNVSRASTSAMVPSSGCSAVSTDGDTATCSKQRFRTVNEEQVQAAVKQRIPKGTQKSTNWGINVWHAWSSVMHSNAMHFTNAAATFVFNLRK